MSEETLDFWLGSVCILFLLLPVVSYFCAPARLENEELAREIEVWLLKDYKRVLAKYQDCDERGLSRSAERQLKTLSSYRESLAFFARNGQRSAVCDQCVDPNFPYYWNFRRLLLEREGGEGNGSLGSPNTERHSDSVSPPH